VNQETGFIAIKCNTEWVSTDLRPNPNWPMGSGSPAPPSDCGLKRSGLNVSGSLYVLLSCVIARALAYTNELQKLASVAVLDSIVAHKCHLPCEHQNELA
jgi:hypothetical protein